MRKIFLLFITLLQFFNSFAQSFCKTPSYISDETTRGLSLKNIPIQNDNLGCYYMRIYFHIIRRSDGTGAENVTINIKKAYNTLVNDFKAHNIYFVWNNEIDYIDCNIYYYYPSINIFSINNHNDGIDIYLYGDNVEGGGYTKEIGNSCGFYISGYMNMFPSLFLASSHVISHEMGHVLGLFHTHHGTSLNERDYTTCSEYVNGSNALTCGDYIEDTPADPGLSMNVEPSSSKWMNWGAKDENGDYYQPNTKLIMSYTHPLCMSYFSYEQGVRMRYSISNIKSLQNALINYIEPTILGLCAFSYTNKYEIKGITDNYVVSWSVNNPAFSLSISGKECTVSYTNGNQYDTAILTATIIHGNTAIKTLTKQITHISEIEGNTVMCNTAEYSVPTLPDGFSVTWSINNTAFGIYPSDSLCSVIYNGTLQYDVATLTATIRNNDNVVGTLSKRIVHHGSSFTAELRQDVCHTPNGISPEKHLYITDGYYYSDDEAIGDEEEVIDNPDEDTDVEYVGTDEAGDMNSVTSVPITGGVEIVLKSEWFDGMTVTFSGETAPVSCIREGANRIRFTMPDTGNDYYAYLNARSPEGCSDFTIRFRIELMPNAVSGDKEIRVEFYGNMLEIYLDGIEYEEQETGEVTLPEWYYSIYDVKRNVYCNYGTIKDERPASVNISDLQNGSYIIRAGYGNHSYSKKFTIRR